MEHYEKLKTLLKKQPIPASILSECLLEDNGRKRKKKKKKKKKRDEEDDIIISFKPLGTCKLKDSQGKKKLFFCSYIYLLQISYGVA